MGMVGTGKVYSFRIERAAKELECSLDKIKVYFTVCPSDAMYKNRIINYSFNYCNDILFLSQRWIKKKNHRMKQTRTGDTNEVIPEAKRVKLTPWQAYMKDFGKSDGMYRYFYVPINYLPAPLPGKCGAWMGLLIVFDHCDIPMGGVFDITQYTNIPCTQIRSGTQYRRSGNLISDHAQWVGY